MQEPACSSYTAINPLQPHPFAVFKAWAARGIAVFSFDFSGMGASEPQDPAQRHLISNLSHLVRSGTELHGAAWAAWGRTGPHGVARARMGMHGGAWARMAMQGGACTQPAAAWMPQQPRVRAHAAACMHLHAQNTMLLLFLNARSMTWRTLPRTSAKSTRRSTYCPSLLAATPPAAW